MKFTYAPRIPQEILNIKARFQSSDYKQLTRPAKPGEMRNAACCQSHIAAMQYSIMISLRKCRVRSGQTAWS